MAQPGGAGPYRGQEREHLLIPRAPEKPALRIGSMALRGNPCNNAMMESVVKTLKIEGVYPVAL